MKVFILKSLFIGLSQQSFIKAFIYITCTVYTVLIFIFIVSLDELLSRATSKLTSHMMHKGTVGICTFCLLFCERILVLFQVFREVPFI